MACSAEFCAKIEKRAGGRPRWGRAGERGPWRQCRVYGRAELVTRAVWWAQRAGVALPGGTANEVERHVQNEEREHCACACVHHCLPTSHRVLA